MHAKYQGVSGAFHSAAELFEKCAASAQTNVRGTSATNPKMLQLFDAHFQK
jgi:hypothetical protein